MQKSTKIGLLFLAGSAILAELSYLFVTKIVKPTIISQNGINLIKSAEGFRDTAYADAGKGILTIGYGHTGSDVYSGQKITSQQGEQLLINDLSRFEKAVSNFTANTNINQNQFDALVSFAYNLGENNLKTSTLLKKIIANPNDNSIRQEFEKWIYAGDKILDGLVKRRKAEADLYFSK